MFSIIPADLQKFERMMDAMDEGYLITGSWGKIKDRISG